MILNVLEIKKGWKERHRKVIISGLHNEFVIATLFLLLSWHISIFFEMFSNEHIVIIWKRYILT